MADTITQKDYIMSKFDDIWSDLEDDIWTTGSDATKPERNSDAKRDLSELYKFTEKCPKCHGRGSFISYSGRNLGPCFACDGAGERRYKTSPEQRRKGRENAARKRSRDQVENLNLLREAYPAEVEFVERGLSFDFYSSLYDQAKKKGTWSEGQLRAIRNGMLKAEQKAAEKAARVAEVPDLTNLRAAFSRASEAGLKRPTLRVDGFVFSKAPDNGANAGHLYVKQHGEYLGKIDPDGLFKYVRSCPSETVTEVVNISGNLLEAATAHGKRTGECSCCGRELTNADSIAAGIGPVCAEKWGF